MRASRGMGDIRPSKMPKAKTIHRRDKPEDVQTFAGGDWIKDAINPKNKGALKRSLGVKKTVPIPALKLATAAKKPGIIGKRVRAPKSFRGMK